MATNYDKLKDVTVVLYDDEVNVKTFTVEEFVKYLNQPIQILDKVEKRYIRNIVAPFWKLVKYIAKKRDFGDEHYYIEIAYEETIYADNITHLYLPSFDMNSEMYSNMEVERRYTLEELGIKFE